MGITVRIDEAGGRRGTGWRPDHPDLRDLTDGDEGIAPLLAKTSVPKLKGQELPPSVDLREWCSPIEDQGELGSCTAHAGVGMVEYLQRKALGKHIDASRRFLYKVSRTLAGLEGDSGAELRNTAGALRVFGVPPETFWPYSEDEFDVEPPAFCYSFAQSYQAVTYYRLDPLGTDPSALLEAIKTHLVSKLPSMFGFAVYPSIRGARTDGKIPFRARGESAKGHAVMAVGYDDGVKIPYAEGETEGALLIRNSWSTDWGEDGYGWLPYAYVLQELAWDWWVLLAEEWVDAGEFGA